MEKDELKNEPKCIWKSSTIDSNVIISNIENFAQKYDENITTDLFDSSTPLWDFTLNKPEIKIADKEMKSEEKDIDIKVEKESIALVIEQTETMNSIIENNVEENENIVLKQNNDIVIEKDANEIYNYKGSYFGKLSTNELPIIQEMMNKSKAPLNPWYLSDGFPDFSKVKKRGLDDFDDLNEEILMKLNKSLHNSNNSIVNIKEFNQQLANELTKMAQEEKSNFISLQNSIINSLDK